jgi:ribosomal protein L39E
VAIQAFTKLLFSFSDVLKTTNCTFQEVDNMFRFTVGIAVYDEFFSCMCATEFLCALDVCARHTLSRKKTSNMKKKKMNNRVPFVIIYHPALSNLSNIVRKHWTTIQKHPSLCKIFKEPRGFCSLFIGPDAFDSESLAVRNTFGAMFRMTTLWGQVLMFICRFVVYVS